MLCFVTDDLHNLLDWFADLEGGVDAAEIVRAQLLQIEKVLDHKCQKALTCTVDVKRVGEFAVNALQPLFQAVRVEVLRIDNLYEVTDLAHLHFHCQILRVDCIQRIARVVRGRSIDCGHQHLFFLLLSHMDRSGLIIELQYEALLTLAENLLVHDLDVLKASLFFLFDWNGELVFEGLQVQLFWFQTRQFFQGPKLILLNFAQIVDFVDQIFLQYRQLQNLIVELSVSITLAV